MFCACDGKSLVVLDLPAGNVIAHKVGQVRCHDNIRFSGSELGSNVRHHTSRNTHKVGSPSSAPPNTAVQI